MTTHDETTDASTHGATAGTTSPEPTSAQATSHPLPGDRTRWGLRNFPPVEEWDHHTQSDPKTREPRDYMLVPTTCFNCESACGLLAYVDKSDLSIRKVEGNPAHPGSRGRNCAKGPATINQIEDPERILFPLKRTGKRGAGEWTRVSWDEALDDIGGRIRTAISEDRHNDVMYHVGRPGEDGFAERFLLAWGVDGHNSHTNICSAGARLGYSLWGGYDRPSPDYAHAKVVLLLSSHLETGHYFNPHAQRIMTAKLDGAKLIVMDPRLSNTASHADAWLTPWPGSEAALLLAVAAYLLREGTYDREFLRRWVNWRAYLENLHPDSPVEFEEFCTRLTEDYQQYTFEYAAEEADVSVEQVRELAEIVAGAEGRLSAHVWRSATAGNRGGWMVSRALMFLVVLTGSVGTKGGTSPNGWDKIIPHGPNMPGGHDRWNELTWPREYPLATNELSILLPHFLREGRGKLDVYFSRVYNPIWTNPDGFSWMEALTDEDRIGCHVALTPTWSETAEFADYILPMGHATERHDTHSYETHAGKWLGFRQPVRRVAMEKLGGTPPDGKDFGDSRDWNPGEVWEETEFWFELSWRIDPDGELGIRRYFESPTRPGERITVDEYYGHIFDHSVPGLPDKAAAEGLTPLQYMRRYGVVEVDKDLYRMDERVLSDAECEGATPDDQGVLRKPVDLDTQVPLVGEAGAVGVQHEDGSRTQGWLTPSRKLEIYSPSMRDWGWPEYATPGYIESHVSRRQIDVAAGERVLIPTFRLPTMIHTRSGNAKYLNEISNSHPLWTNTTDARALGIATGDLVRISTRIGYFVARVWATEGIRPGVTALSHHMGRWRLRDGEGSRWSMGKVDLRQQVGEAGTEWRLRYTEGIKPFRSEDPDSGRIYWDDPGVHQNLTFPVQPDPWSGMHCWLQKVTVEKAHADDEYGDVVVDTAKSREVYEEWIGLTRATLGPGGQRRPEFMMRPVMPQRRAYLVDED